MQYDCIILGGGIVGLTLAALLSDSLDKVAVVDPNLSAHIPQSNYDLRVSAITRSSEKILTSAKAWSQILSYRVSPYEHMTVWDEVEGGEISFHAGDIYEPNLGYIVENSVIRKALLDILQDSESVHLLDKSKALSLTRGQNDLELGLLSNASTQNPEKIRGRLIVGADGGRSWLRGALNIPLLAWDYQHKAIVAQIETEYPHERTAWQRFIHSGPVAVLPLLESNQASIVWSTAPEEADKLLAMVPDDFSNNLRQALDGRLGRIQLKSERAGFPLKMQQARRYIDERSVLVGDAAHTIHPLAGQGVNLGLLDVAALSEVISDACQKGYDIGQESVLRRYERWRRGQNMNMIAMMEGFKQLFGSQVPAIATLRNLGLQATHRASWIKRLIIKQAMGIRGDLPKAAQPTL